MNKLKIGFVLDDSLDTPDGVQQYVLALGSWLSKQGHDVHYLVGETHRTDIANVHALSRNMHVRFNGNGMSTPLPVNPRKIQALLAKEKFDVLHVQMPYSPFLAQQIINKAPSSTAIIGTFHIMPQSGLADAANRFLGFLLRGSLKRFDQVFAVSNAAAGFARKTFNVDADVLPNVVDVTRFASAKPLPQYNDDTLTVMFLGRLVPRKGARTLLEAVSILNQLEKHKSLPPFRVVICGKGPLASELQQYAATEGIEDLVEFAGFIAEDDKPSYLASADIMVFPSSGGESFGIVLIEAMASGRPVVLAGDNPGYRSVLSPKPELLFDPKNAVALSQKLTEYLQVKRTRTEAVTWQKAYVPQFDVATVGKKLLKTYREQLQEKH